MYTQEQYERALSVRTPLPQGHQRPCSDRVENLTFPLYRPSFLFYLVCTPVHRCLPPLSDRFELKKDDKMYGMTPIGVFFTAIFPLEVNEQALCQQPQVGPKSSGFGELPNKHFCGPAACKNFGVWLHPNCLPFRASPKMAQKTEVTLSYAPSVSRACLSPSTVAFTTVSSFSVIELSKTSIAFGSCSHL